MQLQLYNTQFIVHLAIGVYCVVFTDSYAAAAVQYTVYRTCDYINDIFDPV